MREDRKGFPDEVPKLGPELNRPALWVGLRDKLRHKRHGDVTDDASGVRAE